MTDEDIVPNPQQKDGTYRFIETDKCKIDIDVDGNLHLKGDCNGAGLNKNEIHLADRFRKILEKDNLL